MTEDKFNAVFHGLDLLDYQKDALRWRINGLLSASIADTAGTKPVDLLPNALWTRRGSGTDEWWSFKGYQARKDAADQWVLRKGGEELYRHTYLQVVMAHAERALLAAPPAPSVADASHWISVDDRLPDFGEAVLIGWPDGGTDLSYRFRRKDDKSKWSWEGVSEKHHDAPTHWMVLPRMTAPSVADAANSKLLALHKELNKITWMGADEGWDKAIEAVRTRIMEM